MADTYLNYVVLLSRFVKLNEKYLNKLNVKKQELYKKGAHKSELFADIGISISAGGRKYSIKSSTISRWVTKGYIPVLSKTNREVYIDKNALEIIARKYLQDPGQGKKTVKPVTK